MLDAGRNIFEKRDFLYAVFKHRIKIITIIVTAFIATTAGVYVWPKSYQAKSQLLVKLGRENVSAPATAGFQQSGPVITSGVTKDDINSEIEILKSRLIAEKAINEVGLEFLFPTQTAPDSTWDKIKFYIKQSILTVRNMGLRAMYSLDLMEELSPFERGVKAIGKKIKAENLVNSDIIEVSLKWDNPVKAAKLLEVIIELYLKRHSEVHNIPGAAGFFNDQLAEYKDRLASAEDELKAFKAAHNITIIATEKQILLQHIGSTKSELQQMISRRMEAQSVIDKLKEQIGRQEAKKELSKETDRNPVIDSYKLKLVDLELEENRLLSKFVESSPPVVNVRREIERIKKTIAEEEKDVVGTIKTGVNSTLQSLEERLLAEESNAMAVQAKEVSLSGHLAGLQKELNSLNSSELELDRLERQRRMAEEYYALYVKKFEEARISTVMDNARIVNVNIVEPPQAPFEPLWPKKLLTIGAAFGGSIVVSIFFSLFLEYLNPSIKMENDVEHYLSLPHLVTIPDYAYHRSINAVNVVNTAKKEG